MDNDVLRQRHGKKKTASLRQAAIAKTKLIYTSTTDEDDNNNNTNNPSSLDAPAPAQDPSPHLAHLSSPLDTDPEWDYSDTEWWGWVILIATWLVFVVGMGSCLGVWSWAWDVGETPYAPPELEDDDSLPITGYYPALMVCTAVMSWVWVVIAWVGMKYFRHSKMAVEDG